MKTLTDPCRDWTCSTALIIALLVSVTQTARADNTWGNYHWERSSNPVMVNLGDNVDRLKWGAHLDQAAVDWDLSSVLNTPVVSGGTNPKPCRPSDGMVEVCSNDYGNSGWLGVAQIWASGDHIVKGTAKVNDYYHDRSPYDSYSWKQLVICQEIGHTFGLGHQNEDFSTDDTTSCMEYTSAPEGNEHPDAHDYSVLEALYSHLDGDSGGDSGSGGGGDCWPPGKCKNRGEPVGFSEALENPRSWGELVKMSADGGKSVYVQNFGKGYRVITHVTWTLERAKQHRTERH